MLPVFFKYILASKAAFFMYISPRFLVFSAIEHVCFVQAFLLISLPRFRDSVELLAFYHQHGLSWAGGKLEQKHNLFHESIHF